MEKSHKKKKSLIRPAFLKPRGKDKKETKISGLKRMSKGRKISMQKFQSAINVEE